MTTEAKPGLDLKALRAKAEAAAQHLAASTVYHYPLSPEESRRMDSERHAYTEFEEACDSDTILAILDRLESAEREAFNAGVEAAAKLLDAAPDEAPLLFSITKRDMMPAIAIAIRALKRTPKQD